MDGVAGKPWNNDEIEIAIDAYFTMLMWELDGRDYVKAEVRAELEPRLPARSPKSIELKWCNISAVLDESGRPWIAGFKPLPNYQRKLPAVIDAWLGRHAEVRRTIGS